MGKRKNKNKKSVYLYNNVLYDIVSCGGVIYYKNEEKNKPLFLLLKHRKGKRHWDLPKGHIEKGETLKECAIREIIEETGIPKKKLIFIQELDHKSIYEKKRKIRRNKVKIVHLFLFESKTDKIKLSKEHTNFKWLSLPKIKDKLTFDTSFPAFTESFDLIKQMID